MSGSMAVGRIGISHASGSKRSTLNDQISCTDQAATNGQKDAYQKKAFKEWSTSLSTPLPLVRGTGDSGDGQDGKASEDGDV